MQTVLDAARRDGAALVDFRRILSETATISATNTTRIKAVEDDISEIKATLRRLDDKCATSADLARIEQTMTAHGTARQSMSTSRFVAILAFIGVLVAALIQVVGTIVTSHP